MKYETLNLTMAAMALLATRYAGARDAVRALKLAVVVTILAYPWDFFGIQMGAWSYGADLQTLFGVPWQDILLTALLVHITACVLLRHYDAILQEAYGDTEAEYGSTKDAQQHQRQCLLADSQRPEREG